MIEKNERTEKQKMQDELRHAQAAIKEARLAFNHATKRPVTGKSGGEVKALTLHLQQVERMLNQAELLVDKYAASVGVADVADKEEEVEKKKGKKA